MTRYRAAAAIPVITAALLGCMIVPSLIKLGGLMLMLIGLGEAGSTPDSDLADAGQLLVGLGALGSLLLFVPTIRWLEFADWELPQVCAILQLCLLVFPFLPLI